MQTSRNVSDSVIITNGRALARTSLSPSSFIHKERIMTLWQCHGGLKETACKVWSTMGPMGSTDGLPSVEGLQRLNIGLP
jgi:hypothetical protein